MSIAIEYAEVNPANLDVIQPLWEKLNEHHKNKSDRFGQFYATRTFNQRKSDLLEKSQNGYLHIDIATNSNSGAIVGYCISTISKGQGEIDSIFIENNFRNCGIGDNLMLRALHWMDNFSINTKILIVATGNEEVLSFYSRYNFYPRRIILEQPPAH